MSAVLTGPQRGTVRIVLPREADEQFTHGLIQAIYQLDHVDTVKLEGRTLFVTNDMAQHLKGKAFTEMIADFDDEINSVLQGMLDLVTETVRQAQTQLVFSHR